MRSRVRGCSTGPASWSPLINRAQAELARIVRTAENRQAFAADGMISAQSWLRGHGRLSAAAAAQGVRTGRVLEQLPAVAAAHAAGHLTAVHRDTGGRWHTYRPETPRSW